MCRAELSDFILCVHSIQAAGELKMDFTCDDMVLNDDRIAAICFSGMAADKL